MGFKEVKAYLNQAGYGDRVTEFTVSSATVELAAQAVGVDSCYIFRAKEIFETAEGKALLRKWGIPERYVGIGNCILGYGAEGGKKEAAPRKANYIVRV